MTSSSHSDGGRTHAPRLANVADVLLLALATALTAGVVHALVAWIRREVLHDLLRTWMATDLAWMAPAGYLLIFAPFAALLLMPALLLRRTTSVRIAAFVFVTLGALGFLLLFPRLHQYAALALALGIGTRAAAAAASSRRWRRVLVGWSALLAVFVVGAWAWQTAGGASRERARFAALPPAAAGAPNVLLLILDTVRAQNLGMYGYERATTPRLDAFARQGAVFDFAFAAAPWTLPSHASIFTGKYASQQTGDWSSPLTTTDPTIAEVFRDAGYATAGFTANLVATPRGFGLDRGFLRYEDFPRSLEQMVLSTALGQAESAREAWAHIARDRWYGGALRALMRLRLEPRYSYPDHDMKSAADIAGAFLDWQGTHSDRPFFAFLNFFDAHGPYLSPPPYDTMFAKGDRVRDKYDRSIRYLDDQVSALMDSLAARGLLDRTVVILTSDHGEQFGEHGLGWHGNSLYTQLVHVPLLVRYPPRVPAGVRVARQVSLRDLAATMTDLAGLEERRGIAGRSLAAAWGEGGGATSDALSELSKAVNPESTAPNVLGSMHALADDSLHFVRSGDGTLEIFHYRRDPLEEHDLAKGPHAALADHFERRVAEILGAGVQRPARPDSVTRDRP